MRGSAIVSRDSTKTRERMEPIMKMKIVDVVFDMHPSLHESYNDERCYLGMSAFRVLKYVTRCT